ncbi:hypothetical protein LEP1GSC170_3791 [Leptospira interrogans serovar Bataviae str. HAI135]|nr:hypothetical protein LEP1GSC170_3791 [Leptospira interrogans serovar Bataviae str. HAI135]
MKFDFIYKRNLDPTFQILYTNLYDSFFLNLNFIKQLIYRKYISFLFSCLKNPYQKLRVFLEDWSTNRSSTNLVSIFKFQKKP